MKTSELTGAALDWAVAKCEGYQNKDYCPHDQRFRDDDNKWFCPSEDWAQGGPIIEREGISILYRVGVNMTATINGQYEQSVPYNQRGNPQLIAAMRCYVASKMGDEVDVPKELTE